MNQSKLSDLYTCQLLKLYYKFYRNKLPRYFDNFLPEFGIYTLRNDFQDSRLSDVNLEKLMPNIKST